MWGERNATVYTYIGEDAVYFAFTVTDPNLFCDVSQPQGRSTCVELYFAPAGVTSMRDGCYSIRINPMGTGSATAYRLGVYVPNDTKNEWTAINNVDDLIKIAIYVNGSVASAAGDKPAEGTTGYTVEIAISRSLIAWDIDSFRFTAAFVQDKGFSDPRLNNSFIPDTNYVKVETWIVVEKKGTEEEMLTA